MTESNPGPGSAQRPEISDATVTYEQGLLANPEWCAAYPQQAAMLRASLDEAIAATGWAPSVDPRSPAQRVHDQRHGLPPDGKLPDHLARLARPESMAPNPDAVAAQLERAGHDPAAVLADAKEALTNAGSEVAVETLGAHAIAQLAVWAKHVRAAAKTRPTD